MQVLNANLGVLLDGNQEFYTQKEGAKTEAGAGLCSNKVRNVSGQQRQAEARS